jgi:cysteinyl-tRNA synthetase
MSWAHLGEIFDIHGGGIDLIFPHHENEIAQSCCAFDREIMAHYWMHNGFLQVEGEKMSKSLGNFVTIHELLASETFGGRAWSGAILRLAMLRTHYRQPIDWTVKALEDAAKVYNDWMRAIDRVTPSKPTEEFIVALNDDLNFAKAEAHLHILKKSNPAALAACLKFMGFASHEAACDNQSEEAQLAKIGLTKSDLEQLISQRIEARLTKNWTESDRIRDQLESLGVSLKDNKDGTTSWTVIS